MKKLFTMIPFTKEFRQIRSAIQEAMFEAGEQLNEEIEICTPDTISEAGAVTEVLLQNISDADVLIADLSGENPNVMYEIGFAHGREKPVILISQESRHLPFDLSTPLRVIYFSTHPGGSFKSKLVMRIVEILQNPKEFAHPFSHRDGVNARRPTVFISYSHADQDCLQRLQVHLRPLERENQIELWDDTRIDAGAKWQEQIEQALDRAAIAVLLVSADFLASDFVIRNELPPLLRAAEVKGTTILPVILKHCRFTRDKNLSVFQSTNDPKRPLLSLSDGEQEELWSRVTERIENELSTDR